MSRGTILFLEIRRVRPSGAVLIAATKSITYLPEMNSRLNIILLRNWSIIPRCRLGFDGYRKEKILGSA
jgi:hypothetical protein